MSRWTSADTNAERGAPSREQMLLDARGKRVEDIAREMRLITQVGYGWPGKAGNTARMNELSVELARELSVISAGAPK